MAATLAKNTKTFFDCDSSFVRNSGFKKLSKFSQIELTKESKLGFSSISISTSGIFQVISRKPSKLRKQPRAQSSGLGETSDSDSNSPPPGCSRVKVELGRPLGMVLEEDKTGGIFVGELVEGGNAEKSGMISVGDELLATSAIIYNSQESYGGVMVRKGMEVVRLGVRGEKFDTVMAAIGTHPAYMKVTLELQKCKPIEE